MVAAKNIEIPDWNYNCTSCGKCCRKKYVYLTDDDLKRLDTFKWPSDMDLPNKRDVEINSTTYIAHQEKEDACVYLNLDTEMCRIHEKFGYDAKPLGCKVFPYNISQTFKGNYSVIGRFECPAVRENNGNSIANRMRDIRSFIDEMELEKSPDFDSELCAGLSQEKMSQIMRSFYQNIFNNTELQAMEKMILSMMALDRIEKLGSEFINEMDLRELFPSFWERLIEDAKIKAATEMKISRSIVWRFLTILTSFLRRDEEIIHKGAMTRLRRFKELTKLFFGNINLREFGADHPDYAMDRSLLFGTEIDMSDSDVWELCFDLIKIRLQSWQFFGPTHYNLTFFRGMRLLFVSYTLIVALAKWRAIANGASKITVEDVDYAVGEIDTNLGRSALLSLGFSSAIQFQLADMEIYSRVLHNLFKKNGNEAG